MDAQVEHATSERVFTETVHVANKVLWIAVPGKDAPIRIEPGQVIPDWDKWPVVNRRALLSNNSVRPLNAVRIEKEVLNKKVLQDIQLANEKKPDVGSADQFDDLPEIKTPDRKSVV